MLDFQPLEVPESSPASSPRKLQGMDYVRFGAWHARFLALGILKGSPVASLKQIPKDGICTFWRVACSNSGPPEGNPASSPQKTSSGGICAFRCVAYSISSPWRCLKAVQRHRPKSSKGWNLYVSARGIIDFQPLEVPEGNPMASLKKNPREGICTFRRVACSISSPWRFLRRSGSIRVKIVQGKEFVCLGARHAQFPALGGS